MEVMPSHRKVPVVEQSQVSASRFAARDAAEAAGFDEEDVYRAGLVATELASNLVKHASGGEMLIRFVSRSPAAEVELIAIDRGPGMPDIARSMADGHSTSGTPGTGLGAIRRLADDFDIHSQAGKGTVILARLRASRARRRSAPVMEIAGVSVVKSGAPVCGDAWQAHHHPSGALLIIADGLGHGLQADEASRAAIAAVDPDRDGDVVTSLRAMHEGIRHTRGAAGAVADVRPRAGIVTFAGIGNIAGTICGATATRHTVSISGILGHEARQFRGYSYPWESRALVVMHSDGLTSHWSLDDHRGLRQRHPALVAAVLYRDFSRGRDDVTVVAGREAA
jgi:anti-sigma regulatory factor (Ser/Thr protein kinase)